MAEHEEILDVSYTEYTGQVLKIESKEDISVVAYYDNGNYYSTSTLIPSESLYIMYYCVALEDSDLTIIGTADNTDVEITMPSTTGVSVRIRGLTYGANQLATIRINEMERLDIESLNKDISGTKIIAFKHVVVLSSHSGQSGFQAIDQLSTQIPPAATQGQKYIYFGLSNTGGKPTTYKIISLSSQPNQVRYYNSDGSTTALGTLSDAEVYVTTIPSNDFRVIESDKPISVVQLTPDKNNINDFQSMVFLTPVDQWSSNYRFPVKEDNNINTNLYIVASNGDDLKNNDIILDDIPILCDWKPIDGMIK